MEWGRKGGWTRAWITFARSWICNRERMGKVGSPEGVPPSPAARVHPKSGGQQEHPLFLGDEFCSNATLGGEA